LGLCARAGGVLLLHVGGVLGALGEDGDHGADGGLFALLDDDCGHRAGVEGLHFHGGLVGLDLGDGLPLLDLVALFLEPPDEGALGHGVALLGHGDFGGHSYQRMKDEGRRMNRITGNGRRTT
jgi:hypothetical protein